MRGKMNVVYYSSDFFSEMCGISIYSLCNSNKDADSIDIYIVEDKISNKNKERLKSITDEFGRDLIFIKMPSQEEVYPGVKENLGHTYARMAIGEILPKNIHRILSLDSDTLVLDSLKEMYEAEFNENEYVAGVFDCVGRAIQKGVLNCSDDIKYCNAGVFLIDLDKWRKEKVGQKLLQTVQDSTKNDQTMFFLEQDMMNLTFYGHLKLLDPRYNMLTLIALFDYKDVILMKKPVTYYSEQVVKAAKSNPAIVHATTCFYVKKRIWITNSDHPYANMYLKIRNKTPWKDDPMIADNRKQSKRIRATLWHMIPKWCAVRLASFMINEIRPVYARLTGKLAIATIAKQS